MAIEQALVIWIHLTSAAIWVGGSLFIGAVLAPILKSMPYSLEERLQIMVMVGRKFNKIAIPSLVILIGTGIYNSFSFFTQPNLLYSTEYGNILFIKIILVIALIGIYIFHVRLIRKDVEEKIMSKQLEHNQIRKLRLKIIILGQVIVVLSIIIFFLAALLQSGF